MNATEIGPGDDFWESMYRREKDRARFWKDVAQWLVFTHAEGSDEALVAAVEAVSEAHSELEVA